MSPRSLDIDHLRSWVGRTDTAHDVVSVRLVRELAATLDMDRPEPVPGERAPVAVHWCLAPPAARGRLVGPDGHPQRGGFLPPVPLPRRMWAGGMLQIEDRLRVGDVVERRSRIEDVTLKEGRSGVLCFVAVAHEVHTERGLAIRERQDIVYRDGDAAASAMPAVGAPLSRAPDEARWHEDLLADAVRLFRYSALTFNGHRIHYDRDYATRTEGYPGLVVHGPLQATQLLELATSIRGTAPREFRFRGLKPLFDFMPYRSCAKDISAGLQLWIENGDAVRSMEAEARW